MAENLNIREWVRMYREAGLLVCRIIAGQKRPTEKGWPVKTAEPSDFEDGDGVGILCGLLNDGLVCCDLDAPEALGLADSYLPETGWVEGRPGKPRSHRWYYATDVPPGREARTKLVRGGPRSVQYRRRSDKVVLLDLKGSGGQCVVPPSPWAKGGLVEAREWQAFGAPGEATYSALVGCCERLAAACGWAPASAPRPFVPMIYRPDRHRLSARDRRWLARLEPAVSGQGGWLLTYRTVCAIVRRFSLPESELLGLVLEWNARCIPPWRDEELRAKVAHAVQSVKESAS